MITILTHVDFNTNNTFSLTKTGYFFVIFKSDASFECSKMIPIFHSLANKSSDCINMAMIDVNLNRKIIECSSSPVIEVPMYILFKDGNIVAQCSGSKSEEELMSFVNSNYMSSSKVSENFTTTPKTFNFSVPLTLKVNFNPSTGQFTAKSEFFTDNNQDYDIISDTPVQNTFENFMSGLRSKVNNVCQQNLPFNIQVDSDTIIPHNTPWLRLNTLNINQN